MARVKVKLADNIARVVFIESDATNGATVGTNLFMSDGSVATPTTFAAWLGASVGSSGITAHRLLSGLTLGDDHPQYTRKDTLTTRGDLYARGSSTVQRLALGTSAQVLRSNGTDPVWQTVSPVLTLSTDVTGSATFTDLGNATLVTTITANAVTDAKFRQSAATSVVGRSANSTGNVADIAASADNQVLRRSGGALSFGDVPLVASSFANPTASIGLTAVNGSALTAMRSDAAPALSQGISPTWSGTHTFSNPVMLADGSVSNPSAAFSSDLTSGFYLRSAATNNIAFAVGGIRALDFRTGPVAGQVRVGMFAGDGTSASTAMFINDTGNTVALLNLRGDGQAQFVDGAVGSPSGSYINDTDTGRYRAGANSVRDVAGGVASIGFDDNATAGNTRFLIYDVDNGTLERVSVGAADSGGTGFKVLRIPN